MSVPYRDAIIIVIRANNYKPKQDKEIAYNFFDAFTAEISKGPQLHYRSVLLHLIVHSMFPANIVQDG